MIAISLAVSSWTPIENEGVWIIIGAALALGILSAVNILGSGLNDAGVAIIFVITEAISFYANSVSPVFGSDSVFTTPLGSMSLSSVPYYGWLQVFTDFAFGLGIYFLAATGGNVK